MKNSRLRFLSASQSILGHLCPQKHQQNILSNLKVYWENFTVPSESKKRIYNETKTFVSDLKNSHVEIDKVLKDIDRHIHIVRLSDIENELDSVIEVLESLRNLAQDSKDQVSRLQKNIEDLEREETADENLLQVRKSSVIDIIYRALSKGKAQGRIEGLIVGVISGGLVWFITEQVLISTPQPSHRNLTYSLPPVIQLDRKNYDFYFSLHRHNAIAKHGSFLGNFPRSFP